MDNNQGFSLVELMVAVGIIGTMTSIAVPKYQKFKAKASQAEAQSSLHSIYTLQQLYYTEEDTYAVLTIKDDTVNHYEYEDNDIGFTRPAASAIYKYEAEISDEGRAFDATATSKKKLASCSNNDNDIWTVDEDKLMENGTDGGC